jgi:hypothetical protein
MKLGHFVLHFVQFGPLLDEVGAKVTDKVGPKASLMHPRIEARRWNWRWNWRVGSSKMGRW